MGHGVPSAMLMATLRGIVRSTWGRTTDLAALLRTVNADLCGETGGLSDGRFVTVLAVEVDPARRTLSFASAGHDPPLLYDPASGSFRALGDGGGPPLGIADPLELDRAVEETLRPGQVIAVGTDGLWETVSVSGEAFGKERLREVIRRHAHRSAEEICRAILDQLAKFRGHRPLKDDLTLVVVKVC